MKLLLDENLSWKLVELLSDLYPATKHVNEVGLARRADFEIWDFAKANGFAIVSKDSDFAHLAFLRSHPYIQSGCDGVRPCVTVKPDDETDHP